MRESLPQINKVAEGRKRDEEKFYTKLLVEF